MLYGQCQQACDLSPDGDGARISNDQLIWEDVAWKTFMECFAPGTVSSFARNSCAMLLPRLSAAELPVLAGLESDP